MEIKGGSSIRLLLCLNISLFTEWSISGIFRGGARGVMVIVVGNGHGDTSSNQGETDGISHSTNTLGKGMNLIILPPAMGK